MRQGRGDGERSLRFRLGEGDLDLCLVFSTLFFFFSSTSFRTVFRSVDLLLLRLGLLLLVLLLLLLLAVNAGFRFIFARAADDESLDELLDDDDDELERDEDPELELRDELEPLEDCEELDELDELPLLDDEPLRFLRLFFSFLSVDGSSSSRPPFDESFTAISNNYSNKQ